MSLRKAFVRQFHRPRGLLGRAAGWVMLNRESNVLRGDLTLSLLDPQRTDTVCELGPGPGLLLTKLLKRCDNVIAVDHSELMINICQRRNAAAVRDGRLRLVQGSFTHLPDVGPVDCFVAINALQFDALEPTTLAAIGAQLADGGKFVITQQPRSAAPVSADVDRLAEKISACLVEAGLELEAVERLNLEPVDAACVIARRSIA